MCALLIHKLNESIGAGQINAKGVGGVKKVLGFHLESACGLSVLKNSLNEKFKEVRKWQDPAKALKQ